MAEVVRILGLDPGLRNAGWGIIESQGNRLIHVAHGVVHSDSSLSLSSRLQQIYQGLQQIIANFQPDEAAVEETFVNANAASALKLGMARGVVLLAPAVHSMPVGEYSANKVKKSVVGVGHADKTQVAAMVQRLLPAAGMVTADAADALAVAICHVHHRQLNQKLGLLRA
ncbi:crossover junction endodeoxyribonuclease RuvC [Candidatus Odyssella acanthamoebae]|uniref:Crossover junction endodeoxyribonuclease RuvC n=1 Tax=Candidatus Odyssella acanthamoebae TaxID=91604 RepID=A0A077AWN3_9PROT|nr:crossover junction endodeoxyribonuclease RuvC [Candidatus Paracaedibacter acanthamoebae]AIK96881.1 Holliday junction resolvase [Candidatus Paracaedibacter acanthamoebae]